MEDAARLVGRQKLAAELNVDEDELTGWIEGKAEIPGRAFTKLSAVLVKVATKKI